MESTSGKEQESGKVKELRPRNRKAKKNKELSPRQESILAYIQDFIRVHGYAPSIRDIQVNLGISSTSVVAYNLKALEECGKLIREGKISRGIRVVGTTSPLSHGRTLEIPMLGVITAGQPLPHPEDTSSGHEKIDVPLDILPLPRNKQIYALRVRGDSMIDALIDDGDIVLIRYQETAQNGDLVAALLKDEHAVTLKKFYHEGERIRLQPANKTMDPIYTAPDNVHIQGRVVAVLRSLS